MEKRRFSFGDYYVVQESKKWNAIYNEYGTFITHRENWNNACNVAKLLQEAFDEGREYQRDIENGW
jgi:hypothetical protein